jgi:lipid II isoglutaminyl synthase (glutamine-hydrolysing)
MKLTIGYLYPDLMNIYGDIGNVICLQRRAEWRGIEVEIRLKNLDSRLKIKDCDLYFFGGGQDQQQNLVAKDLLRHKKVLKTEVERGVPILAICGGYQLLGEYYQPAKGAKLKGLNIFPVFTQASDQRMIGNIVISTHFGDLVGFENHSGKTFLKESGTSLGTVKSGFGNNGEDQTEGCIYKNAVGCYLHGSLLPKNPKLADWLIEKALEVKYGKEISLKPLDDTLEDQAHNSAVQKFL